ncbi:MAG: DNA-processing protein DprA [Microbacteriaceae bacterium]
MTPHTTNPEPASANPMPAKPSEWLGLSLEECARLAVAVGAGAADPRDVIAAAASSVIAEPGDSTWGDCVAEQGVAAAVGALVQSANASDFARSIGVPPNEAIAQGWERWTPRLSQYATVSALEHAAHLNARMLLPSDDEWPAGLFDLGPHMPQALYVRGQVEQNWSLAIALVGARAATGYGEHVAAEFAGELSANGCLVTSGAAYGIDGVAHRAALAEEQPTVAFLAGGIDRLYPAGHVELLQRIATTGLVVSETPCGTIPSKWRFLQRNRLIAAATQATIVIEAGARSGSLNTASHAATLGRPLGAVPGPVTSPASAGCHVLLRDFDAICVTSADQVRELAWGEPALFDADYEPAELGRARDALDRRARSIEEIAVRAGLSVSITSGLLAEGELRGWARCTTDGWIRATLQR